MEEAGSESFKHTATELNVSDGEVRQKLTSLPFLCLAGLDISAWSCILICLLPVLFVQLGLITELSSV